MARASRRKSSSKKRRQKKPPLGSGERFRRLKAQLARKGVDNPEALAAWIGRKKYGKKRFQQLAARGLRRKLRKKGRK